MYIKLTRFDNTPVWINAAFVVTVEPRKQGAGSIVVPIGDGLDYEVRETPEAVLAMLEGAPVATVVPVPPPKALTATPEDVSGDSPMAVANDIFAKPQDSQENPEFTAPQPVGGADAKPEGGDGQNAGKPTKKPRRRHFPRKFHNQNKG